MASEVAYGDGGGGSAGIPVDTSFISKWWVAQGPSPGTNGDLNLLPDHPSVGAVQDIVPHPTNPQIVYLAAVNGGVWRTTNATATRVTWEPLTDDQPSLSCGDLDMDPLDSSRQTLVVGIAGRSSFGARGVLSGILRTRDGGRTWSALGGNTLANQQIYGVAARGNFIMVASDSNGGGVFTSRNAGQTFSRLPTIPAGRADALVGDPNSTHRFYVHIRGVGIFRTDGTNSTPVTTSTAALRGNSVTISVGANNFVYAATVPPGRGTASQVFRSSNFGTTWTQMDSILVNAQGNHYAICAHPTNPNLVFMAGEYIRSGFPYAGYIVRGNSFAPSGSQWTSLVSTQGIIPGTPGGAPHTDSRVIAFSPDGTMFEGNDGGIYRCLSPTTTANGVTPGGTSAWSSMNDTLQVTELHNIAYDRVSKLVFGGTQDNGSMAQQLPGYPIWNKIVNGDGGDAAVDVVSLPGQSIRYESSQFLGGFDGRIHNPDNSSAGTVGANTVTTSGTGLVRGSRGNSQFVTPIALNNINPSNMIIGANSLYESFDQGRTVREIAPGLRANNQTRMAYGGRTATSTNLSALYVGVGNTVFVRAAGTGAPTASVTPFPGGNIEEIVMDPDNWGRAYVADATDVYQTITTGANWLRITGNLTGVGTLNAVEYLTLPDGDAIAVGTDQGVYITRLSNLGNWTKLGSNMPNAPVFDLDYDEVDNLLAAAPVGRGTFIFFFDKPILYVHNTNDDGIGSLREAMKEANRSDAPAIIEVRASGTLALQSPLPFVEDGIDLRVAGNNNFTINGGNNFAIFNFNGGITNRIKGIRIADAFSASHGAAFRNPSLLILEDCVVDNSLVIGSFGGALCNWTSGRVYATNCVFSNNSVIGGYGESLSASDSGGGGGGGGGFGGAIYSQGDEVVLHGCSVTNNSARGGNGGAGGLNGTSPDGGNGGFPLRGEGGAEDSGGDPGGFGGGGGGGGSTSTLDIMVPGGAGGFAGGGGGAGGRRGGGSGGAGGVGGEFGGVGGTSCCSHGAGGGGGAGLGGGLFIRSGDAKLVDTVISGNSATHGTGGFGSFGYGTGENGQGVGGGIFNLDGNVSYQYATINNNTASTAFPDADFTTHVTSVADSGPNSLRQAINNANAAPGDDTVTFAANLSGETIRLTSGELEILDRSGNLSLSGAELDDGLTLSGENLSRVLRVGLGARSTIDSLTFTSGLGDSQGGGGLFNQGTTVVRNSTFTGNRSSDRGGAVRNNRPTARLVIENCTLALNNSPGAGALVNDGGARLTMRHCTVVSNTVTSPAGGMWLFNGPVTLEHTIVANNSGGPDIVRTSSSYSSVFHNLIGNGDSSGITDGFNRNIVGTAVERADPLVLPLSNNGGTTMTMGLRGSSIARDAGDTQFIGSNSYDQRGYPRVAGAAIDIGAVENCLYAFYDFDGFTIWDETRNSTATYQGGGTAWWNTDQLGQGNSAIALNDGAAFGVENYYHLTTLDDSNGDLGLRGDFTVSVWIRPRELSGWQIVLGNTGPGESGTLHFGLFDDNVHFGFWGNDLRGVKTIVPFQWTHLAFTYSEHGGVMAIYVNGQLDSSVAGRINTTKTGDVLIGFCEAIADSYFHGLINDFAIYCEALSANQVTALANSSVRPDAILPKPSLPALPVAEALWSIREIHSHPIVPTSLTAAEAVAASPNLGVIVDYTDILLDRFDPERPGLGGFFSNEVPFESNNNTPQGLIDGDDNNFVLTATCEIGIEVEDDYTFGFSSDDGARLRVVGQPWLSSTRLNLINAADPAHRGETLIFPNPTGNSDTLGVVHLTPGTYQLEFLTWEQTGGADCEVFSARGARTSVDGAFRLISPGMFLPAAELVLERVSSSSIRVFWSRGRLQSAPSLDGPWQDVPGATSGQLIPIDSNQQFFRAEQ